jgi:hypothetical protein
MRDKLEQYRDNSARYLREAEEASDPAQKVWLLEMTRSWLALAEQAARNSRTDVVYETPPASPDQQQPVAQQQQQQIQREKEKEEC